MVEVRGKLLAQLEGVVADIETVLSAARSGDGKTPKCKACGSFIPGVSKLNLRDTLMALRELKSVLPAQIEVEGAFEMGVVLATGPLLSPNQAKP